MPNVMPKTRKKFRPTNILAPFSLYNRSRTYQKLPHKNLKLSVLKLDGSSFSVHVARNATVARLELAIEQEFSLFDRNEREDLWSLVWSNFCLCYKGQKLIRDTVPIQKYGIKDGDQLHFIQHLRIDLAPTQQQPKKSRKKHRITHEDHQHTPFDSGDGSAFLPERRSGLTHSLMGLLPWLKFQHSKRMNPS